MTFITFFAATEEITSATCGTDPRRQRLAEHYNQVNIYPMILSFPFRISLLDEYFLMQYGPKKALFLCESADY